MIAPTEEVLREGFDEGPPRGRTVRTLDTTGQVCPYPALLAKKALESLGPGEVLEVVTNNGATALRSIPALCRQVSAEYLVLREGPEAWRAFIRRR